MASEFVLSAQNADEAKKLQAAFEFLTRFGYALVPGPLAFNSDGLATRHSCAFITEPEFAEAYRLGIATNPGFPEDPNIQWRVHVACWAAKHASALSGDFVECGVNTGILSRAIMHVLAFETLTERRFFLLDTYDGMPAEQLTTGEVEAGFTTYNSQYPDCYEQVVETFRPYPNAVIIRGKVPDTLSQVDTSRICYLSIDMNAVVPEIAAAEYLWDKLVPGAVVLLDDYGWGMHVEQRHAFDKFAEEKGSRILCLPTGQGLIIKTQYQSS